MKRVLVALLAISMAAGALTGCGSKGSEKTFTVGFDAEFPPYGYRDDSGEYVGFDLDLAAEVCKRQGWELVKRLSTGMPRIWSFLPGPLTVSGTVSP